jgi:hypothetical protein
LFNPFPAGRSSIVKRFTASLLDFDRVPGTRGLEVMQEVHGRGVRMSIVTNSIAATDEPLVHTAYQ